MKFCVYILSMLIMLPLVLIYWIYAIIRGRQGAFADCSQLIALIPGLPGVFLRWGFYRWILSACGWNAYIGFGTIFSHPTVKIGTSVYIGSYCIIGDADLQDDCILASGVSVCNGTKQHLFEKIDVPIREQGGVYVPIVIGRDSWIGEKAVILANIGSQAVVGAGAVVCKDVAPLHIVVGNPAETIAVRRNEMP